MAAIVIEEWRGSVRMRAKQRSAIWCLGDDPKRGLSRVREQNFEGEMMRARGRENNEWHGGARSLNSSTLAES